MAFAKRTLWGEIVRKRHLYLFLLPTFALLGFLSYYPAISAVYHSFFEWNGFNINRFVGFQNFIDAWTDPILALSVNNTIILMLFGLFITVSFPLIAAEFIFNLRSSRQQYWYRVLFVIPMVVPGMVTLMIWKFVYDPDIGLINQFLQVLGLNNLTQLWFGDPDLALPAIMFIGFPWVGGMNFLIYLAGLQAIPQSILDSATIDGVSAISRFWHIDRPLLIPQFRLLIILSLINSIQAFGHILVLTGGGPGYATMVPGLHLYQNAFTYNKMGYACAIGMIMFVVVLGLTFLNMRFMKSSVEYGES